MCVIHGVEKCLLSRKCKKLLVNYKEVRLGEVIYQRVQHAANKALLIHFAAFVSLLFGCSHLPPPQHLGHDKCKCHLWLGTKAGKGQSVNTSGGRKSATLVVMNRYRISFEIILCKLLSVRRLALHFLLLLHQRISSQRIQHLGLILFTITLFQKYFK